MAEEFFFYGVPVEPGEVHSRRVMVARARAAGFQIAGEALDAGTAGLEQMELVLVAPGRVLTQVQFVGLPGQAAVPGEEPR